MGLRVKITSSDTPAKIAVLCDSPDPLPTFNFRLNNRRVLQIQDFFRTPYVSVFGRGNKVNRLSFEVARSKDTLGTEFTNVLSAVLFAMDMGNAVPETGLVELVLTEGDVTATRWIANAGIEMVDLTRHKGILLFQQFTIVGGLFLSKNPNT